MKQGDFSAQADAYRRSRPPYPTALVDQLITDAHVGPGDKVADLGAGTGILSAQLAERGLLVSAVEPNPSMSALAPVIDGARFIEGSFEASGLDEASQRWVVAAQAFHWADPALALPEMARVLAPGCAFTVLWNNRENDAHPVLSWTRDAIHRYVPGFDDNYRERDWAEVLRQGGCFEEVSYREQHHSVPMSAQRYVDLWRSHHRLTTAAGPEHFGALIAEVSAYLQAQNIEEVSVPYRCRAWTAR